MEWISWEKCSHSVTLRYSNWFGTDWSPPRYLLGGPEWDSVAQIFAHGFHLMVGPLHPGFSLAKGRIHPTVTEVANYPLLKARKAHSVFHCTVLWLPPLSPLLVWGGGTAHAETLTGFTQQASSPGCSLERGLCI